MTDAELTKLKFDIRNNSMLTAKQVKPLVEAYEALMVALESATAAAPVELATAAAPVEVPKW